jgi:hypothetical protein
VPGPVLPPQLPGPISIPPGPNTVRNVCTNALYEINVVAPGEVPSQLEMAFVLNQFNQLLDSWNTRAERIFAYDLISSFPGVQAGGGNPAIPAAPFLFSPGLDPHTIGPYSVGAPTFRVAIERPVRIRNINVLLNNVFPIVRFPLTKRDKDWWATQRLQGIQTSLPTDFYYRPDWPLGSIFFWPVPNYAYGVEIEIETVLVGAPSLDTQFIFPPGYEMAITKTLAELLCAPFEKPPNPILVQAASAARSAVAGLNAEPPRINLDGFGPPSTGKKRASWNYHTGYSGR